MRFGERDGHGKATTEILHVVQNDGPWGVGRKPGGPWEQKELQLRFGERDAHGMATTEILHVVQNDGPWGLGRKLGGPWEQKEPQLRFGERDAHGMAREPRVVAASLLRYQ